ncbi:receptor-type tyrosine-protein phosphatase H-like [Polymixia lowei]
MGNKYTFTLFTVFEGVRSSGVNHTAVTVPRNAEDFKAVDQDETSITLQWNTVNNIFNYILVFNGRETNIPAPGGSGPVTHTVSGLTMGNKYTFTLFTVFEGVRSTGVRHTAVTAPPNAEDFTAVDQNETSITLQWNTVNNIFNYILMFNGRETNIPAPGGSGPVTHTVSGLTMGNKYTFTLFTVFEGVRSTGVNHTAVTAPRNAEDFQKRDQDETSITLQWNTVNNFNYILVFNGRETNIPAPGGSGPVTHTVSGLTMGNKYTFTLFTVFEGVRSTGVNHTAVTAPRNAEDFTAVDQDETSITLQWNTVNNFNYTLVFNGNEINFPAPGGTPRNAEDFQKRDQDETSITLQWNTVNNFNYILVFNEREINIPASDNKPTTYTVLSLSAGQQYTFTLFTVFEGVRSSGVNHTAVTAPRNAEDFKAVDQNETSITLQWNTVNNIFSYILVFNGRETNITAPGGSGPVTHTVSGLTMGNKYSFTLFTVFEGVRSSGVNHTAVTVPLNVAAVIVVDRSTTSVTLQWKKVHGISDYPLLFGGERKHFSDNQDPSSDIMIRTVSSLQAGTEYSFTLFTLFHGVWSSGLKDFTLTTIDCAASPWQVTNTSIQGTIQGLFSNATATNGSGSHVSPGGGAVWFPGLYPGSTYLVSLLYEKGSKVFPQCDHSLTIIPPDLKAHCDYSAAGYSISVGWEAPDGVWTGVEVHVSGKTHPVHNNRELETQISGFQPAKTYQVSVASLSGTLRSNLYIFNCSTDPRGVIAGAVMAVIIICLLICLAVFIWRRKPHLFRLVLPCRKESFVGRSTLSSNNLKAIPVGRFPDHVRQMSVDDNRGFSEEYESFIPVGTEQTRKAAIVPENKAKNRFANVYPYDWSRVKLTTVNQDESSDYINASYMPGYSSNREYIAAQGPLPSTVQDFWRMIWEQGVKGIVTVTNCTEGGRTKCEQYWPLDYTPCLYGDLLVTIRSEQREPNWTLREFGVKNKRTSEDRTVKHFHFTAWPDHGVPEGTEALIQFRGLVRHHIESDWAGAPTVVHCSGGVGNTGTIIALDVVLQQLETERAVGIAAFVHKMRLSRPLMVQTESQYVFLHECIMNSLQPKPIVEETIYENLDMIYANATALREFR